MKHIKIISALFLVLCFMLIISGCKTKTKDTTEINKTREPVKYLQCTQPTAINSLCSASGSQVAISRSNYESERTTVQLVNVNNDTVCHEITFDGIWDLTEQTFSDGRFALCRRETNTWKFLSASLEELSIWNAENADGFFSYDGSAYYYVKDNMLYRQKVISGENGKVTLPLDLRLLELTAFDAPNGILLMQFFLSPYSNECGTAAFDVNTGTFTMLQKDRYQASFIGENICLLSFDNEKMRYSVTYGSGDRFYFADADIFSDAVSDLFAICGSPYLMGIASGSSILYSADQRITSCPLIGCGIDGEMYYVCYLADENVLVGAVCQDNAFRLCVIDPSQLSFTDVADAASVDSPLTVNESLAQSYWDTASDAPVAESLQEARQYADNLEKKYSVRILLSSECEEAAELCEDALILTDTMTADEELSGIRTMLKALDHSLALYPEGFPAQFRNDAGDGGLCFLLVAHIERNYTVVGSAYDRLDWQYIALDVSETNGLDSIVCHEIWHATENRILSFDYTAFSTDEWNALNPAGFSYYGDATQTDPSQLWMLYTDSPENIHFVDSYACVNSREDRARIMEYFMTHDDEAKILIQSPFIRQKLQMMCDAIRNTFDTTDWENVCWERLL